MNFFYIFYNDMKCHDTKRQVTTKKMMDGLYNDRFLANMFLPLIMQLFRCLQQ
jgi:hypothetical protein